MSEQEALGVLVVKVSRPLSQEQEEALMRQLAAIKGYQAVIVASEMEVTTHPSLQPLVDAITAQTKAIHELAASNADLLDAIAGEDEPVGDEPATTYLSGEPV